MFSAFKIGITIFVAITIIVLQHENLVDGQTTITLEYLQELSDYIDTLNATNKMFQQRINILQGAITDFRTQQTNDYTALFTRIANANGSVISLNNAVLAAADATNVLEANVISLANDINGVMKNMTKLDTTAQMWLSNWKVVNRTFSQLKKRLRLQIRYRIRVVG